MYTLDKATGDIVISGFEKGIAPSPLKGIANLQNVNIATDEGAVLVPYNRAQQTATETNSTGTLLFSDSAHVGMSISGANGFFKGFWITVSSSTHTGELANGTYYVLPSFSGGYQLSTTYNGSIISGYTAGLTATISMFRNMGNPLAYAIESYFDSSSVQYYRYYVLDSQGLIWVYDTLNDALYSSSDNVAWFLPDTSITYFGSDASPSGLCILSGWLHVFSGNKIWVKPTVNLGSAFVQMTNVSLMSRANTTNIHFALVGHQGRAYYTDGSFLGSIFPDTSLLTGVNNVQSYASFTAATSTCTISALISGSTPSTGANVSATGFSRIPVCFFPTTGGTKPTNVTLNTVYYIQFSTANQTFEVYAALTGGSAIDMSGGVGTQYYNTYFPVGTHAAAYGDTSTVTFTPQRLTLPQFEVAQCMAEIGNNIIVGAVGNILYPWNQVDPLPGNLIPLPENNTQKLLTVNQMAYVFAGNKGNIYITDGSIASLVTKVPDYCAGVPGTINSYFEPSFFWGGVAYIRGRVYFSIRDQISGKAGNCGGIWSFYPTQNLAYGQDTGLALRLENQNSYGDYNGVANIIITNQVQTAKSPQYWTGWASSITSAVHGIDYTAANVSTKAIIESDLIPTGTMLEKKTFSQIEYKTAYPLQSGDTIQLYYRVTQTDAWTTCGTVKTETSQTLSGYFDVTFEKTQWTQLRAEMFASAGTNGSQCPLAQIRMR